MVTLGCNIHDWMIACILVVSTPWYARTDANGVARIRDIPAGSYELRAWRPNQRTALEGSPLVLEASARQSPQFVLDLAPRKVHSSRPSTG